MVKRLRIVSGLILFAFVTSHLLNVSLGLHSVEAMDWARPVFMGLWASPFGALLLALSLAVHFALGLWSIYWRNTLKMSPSDTIQLVASLAIVPLLTPHVVGTAIAAQFGVVPTFGNLIPYFWIDEPLEGLRQVLLLTFLWIHGCIGFYAWARVQRWWLRTGAFLYPLAVAIPVFALLGFVEAGNQAIERFENPPEAVIEVPAEEPLPAAAVDDAQPEVTQARRLPFDEILRILSRINWTVFYIYLGLLAVTFSARQLRVRGARQEVHIFFDDRPAISGHTGLTLLEIARLNHMPVAHLCRGRGRCGTCRVRVLESSASLPPMSDAERATLARVKAGPDVRLSCQMRPPAGFLHVERLLPSFLRPRDLHREAPQPHADAAPEVTASAA